MKDEPASVAASSFYVALRGGVTFPENTDFEVLTLDVENEYEDVGGIVSGAIGYEVMRFGSGGLRAELEVGYFSNDIEAHDVETLGKISGDDAFGETTGVFGLVNLFYDFGSFYGVKPFIGGGVGLAKVDFKEHGVSAVGVVMDDDDTGFAYQLSAGVNVDISESVGIELGYRYLGVTGLELEAVDGTSSDVDVENHVIYGGLKFRL